MKLRVISPTIGHRCVDVTYLECKTMANADSNGHAFAKHPMKLVDLLDDNGKVLKSYTIFPK